MTAKLALIQDMARLLTPEEAAARLGVEVRWLYRHHKQFTFSRKLSRKCLRFDPAGLQDYIANGTGNRWRA